MSGEVEHKPDAFSRIATRNLDRADEARRTILEEHSAAFRWLMASLLAINAGGLLALSDNLQSANLVVTGGLFLIGVLASLFIGVFSQRLNQRMIAHLTNVTNFWIEAYETDEFDSQAHQQLMEAETEMVKGALASRVSGWLSALCFAGAVLSMGYEGYQNAQNPVLLPPGSVEVPSAANNALPSVRRGPR